MHTTKSFARISLISFDPWCQCYTKIAMALSFCWSFKWIRLEGNGAVWACRSMVKCHNMIELWSVLSTGCRFGFMQSKQILKFIAYDRFEMGYWLEREYRNGNAGYLIWEFRLSWSQNQNIDIMVHAKGEGLTLCEHMSWPICIH